MWPWFTFLLSSLLVLHLFWRKRYHVLLDQLSTEKRKALDATTERDQFVEQELSKRQTFFDRMVEGVLLVDDEDRVEFVNLALRRLLGLTQNIEGRTLKESLNLDQLVQLADRARIEGQVLGEELEFPEIAPRVLQVNASSFQDIGARRRGVLFVFHDVTRIKQFEATRKEFVANVSHELRTPLSLIKGFTETLLENDNRSPEITTRFLQSIDKHADRLTFLIEDLLILSRLESGQVHLNVQPVQLSEVVAGVFEDLHSRALEKEMKLLNEISPDRFASADRERLQQVFFNLIENAIKYGKPQGKVTVSARDLADGRVELCVHDDGPGIPLEARERVFERFYRVDRARSRESGGTGLGLSIVKHIVQTHQGEVWVQSSAGAGASFFFTLPGVEPNAQ